MTFFNKNKITLAIGTAALSLAILASSALFSAQRAEAQIPVTDVASLAQSIQDGITRVMESEIMQQIEQTGLDMMALFSEMEIDNVNNAFSNMIARTGKAMQDIQNTEQLEKSMPAQDVCDTMTLSVNLEDMLCGMESQVSTYNSEQAALVAMMTGRGSIVCNGDICSIVDTPPTNYEVQKQNEKEAKKIVDKCDAIKGATGADLCNQASLVVNPPPQGTNAEQYKAVEVMNELAAGVLIQPPRSNDAMKSAKGTPVHDKLLALDARDAYFRNSLKSSLQMNTLLKEGTLEGNIRKPGEVISLDMYLATRLGSQNWLCEVTNTCKAPLMAQGSAPTPYVSPAELEKRKAEMDAVLLYINMQQYKSMLRIERTLADIGLMAVNPTGKSK
jgi:hypothetical protein